jgi:predicted DsbA family dithiol-disulfide isomerase
MAIEVKIIGTDPPCPRCVIMGCLVSETAEELHIAFSIDHISYETEQAVRIGQGINMTVGTAKHVAYAADLTVDWVAIHRIIENPPSQQHLCRNPESIASKWSPELDEMLRPCEEAALFAGILMTPVLIIGGKIVCSGSVPTREQVRD